MQHHTINENVQHDRFLKILKMCPDLLHEGLEVFIIRTKVWSNTVCYYVHHELFLKGEHEK